MLFVGVDVHKGPSQVNGRQFGRPNPQTSADPYFARGVRTGSLHYWGGGEIRVFTRVQGALPHR